MSNKSNKKSTQFIKNRRLKMTVILVIFLLLLVVYLLNNYLLSHWTRQNIPQDNPLFFFGNGKPLFMRQQSFIEFFENIYKKYKNHRFFGIYMLYKPVLIINDPKLIQNILIRDFTVFHDRPMPADSADFYPLMANLFNMQGKKWRDLRVRLTPAFTAGKLRKMIPIQKSSTQLLLDHVQQKIQNGDDVFDIREIIARYLLSAISSVGFGIENDCINEPDNMFRKVSLMIFDNSVRNGIMMFLMFFAPDLFTRLRLDPFPPEVSPFIYSLVNQTIEYREKNNYHRNDFLDLLIKLKNVGYLPADNDDEDEWTREQTDVDRTKKMSMDEVVAQSFVFTIGGFETISAGINICLFEVTRNPQILNKLLHEIDSILDASSSDDITYDALSEMKYMDCCINETLRKYPLAGLLNRVNSKDYKIPDSNVTIKKGTSIFIPFIGFQRDPKFYDDPLKFQPERFENSTNGSTKNIEGIFYAPFGDGPRHCIGMRLARMQLKYAIATCLRHFNFELDDKSYLTKEIKFDPKYMMMTPIEPIMLKISLRK